MEGTAGWNPGKPMPGNLNMAYSTETLGMATCRESTVLGLLEESSWSTLVHTQLVQVVQHRKFAQQFLRFILLLASFLRTC